jgi:hypothetical protein
MISCAGAVAVHKASGGREAGESGLRRIYQLLLICINMCIAVNKGISICKNGCYAFGALQFNTVCLKTNYHNHDPFRLVAPVGLGMSVGSNGAMATPTSSSRSGFARFVYTPGLCTSYRASKWSSAR